MTGIVSFGGYIPRLRLQRKAVATANAWVAPNLMGSAKGERSMANWDEDAITMAVEAGRDCLPGADPLTARAHVDAVYFASTTAPFSSMTRISRRPCANACMRVVSMGNDRPTLYSRTPASAAGSAAATVW